MSRLAKKPIVIPEKTEVKISGSLVTVKGPLGEISKTFRPLIEMTLDGKTISMKPKVSNNETKAMLGTYVAHVKNMLSGVNTPFERKLIIEGIGYKADAKGDEVVMALGFSHPVKIKIPKGLKVLTEKGLITISGSDKELVGQFAAMVRAQKKPEPYKGKGIRYSDEVIRRKQGKKTV